MLKSLKSVILTSLVAITAVGCGTGPRMAMAPGTAVAAQSAKNAPFRLCTYNVKNLYDVAQPGLDGGNSTPVKPVKEREALALTMHKVNADVVGLVEIQSKEALTKFRDQYLGDMGYTNVVFVKGNDPRSSNVALISRFPVTNVVSHKDETFPVPGLSGPQKFSRDLLEVHMQAPSGYRFTVFQSHLKSQHGGDEADVKRLAEGQQVRKIIDRFDAANPRANYAVCGDLNDVAQSPPVQAITNRPNSPLLDPIGMIGDWIYTYHPKQYRSRIDYILLSKGMAADYIQGSVEVLRKFDEEFTNYKASDHLPAYLDIQGGSDR